jgi:hypothetical protein
MSVSPFLQWSQGSFNMLHGHDPFAQADVDKPCLLGVVFPQFLSDPQILLLSSAATGLPTEYAYTLKNVSFFLSGDTDAVQTLLGWAPDAGAEISFDAGASWTQFSPAAGNPLDPSTWIPMAGTAVSLVAPDGQILPTDTARILIRLKTPPAPEVYGVAQFRLGVDFDVF